jgi:stage III sporulation protein AF
MMDWLSIWLREIILVILLATFIDLLLPGSSMQRYVKVVVSLFILMTILSPLIMLLKTDFNFSEFTWSIDEVGTAEMKQINKSAAMVPLSQVIKDGKALEAEQIKKTQSMVEERLSDEMRAQLEQGGSLQLKHVAVRTNFRESEGYYIDTVQITLSAAEEAVPASAFKQAKAASPSTDIKPIEKVEININLEDNSTQASTIQKREPSNSAQFKAEEDRIITLLNNQWALKSDQIYISMDEELK